MSFQCHYSNTSKLKISIDINTYFTLIKLLSINIKPTIQAIKMENAAAAVSKLFAKDPVATQPEDETMTSTPSTPAPVDISTTADATAKVEVEPVVEHVDKKAKTEVAPAIEHTHVTKAHETREQKFVEKEKHQDHYHTTIQPLVDSEVVPEKHDHVQETKKRSINRDDGSAKARAEADVVDSGLENTKDEVRAELEVKEPTQVKENVHHHYHETIQPVIEKGMFIY